MLRSSSKNIHAEAYRKLTRAINNQIQIRHKSAKTAQFSTIMEHLKTLRSYLTNNNNSNSNAPTTLSDKKEEETMEQVGQLGAVPANSETGGLPNNGAKPSRFPNFLSFRSQSDKHLDHSTAAPRTKFIKTANATRQARKSMDKVNSSPSTFDRNLKADPSKLFTVIDSEYDKLIKHF